MLNISPKVLAPFLAGLVAFVVSWISSGSFDGPTLTILVSTFIYGALGVAAPAAPEVTQHEVSTISRRRRGK